MKNLLAAIGAVAECLISFVTGLLMGLSLLVLICIGPIGWIIILFWALHDSHNDKERRHEELIKAINDASRTDQGKGADRPRR